MIIIISTGKRYSSTPYFSIFPPPFRAAPIVNSAPPISCISTLSRPSHLNSNNFNNNN